MSNPPSASGSEDSKSVSRSQSPSVDISSKNDANDIDNAKGKSKDVDASEQDDNNTVEPTITRDEDDNEDGEEDEREGEDANDNNDDSPSVEMSGGAPIIKQGDWQAIYSPQHANYYFHNAKTGETTWSNPLAASAMPSGSTIPDQSQQQQTKHDPTQAAVAAGIDPELAYLDPTLALGSTAPGEGSFVAKFNARTGAFTPQSGRDPTHLGEYERMQRMSTVYFDTGAYEREVQRRKAEEDLEEAEGAKKKKKVTKKDLERFKEQKRQKKIAKTAWLRT